MYVDPRREPPPMPWQTRHDLPADLMLPTCPAEATVLVCANLAAFASPINSPTLCAARATRQHAIEALQAERVREARRRRSAQRQHEWATS
jgi:hypothetical protein